MAIVSAYETTENTGAVKTTRGREYWRSFLVTTDSADTKAVDVRLAVGNTDYLPSGTMPAYITCGHPDDWNVFCKSVEPRMRNGSRTVWDVYAHYSQAQGLVGSEDAVEDPLHPDRIAAVEISSIEVTRVFEKDLAGTAVVNSAGQPYEQPLELPVKLPHYVFTQNEAFTSDIPVRADAYTGGINNADFTLLGTPRAAYSLSVDVTASAAKASGVRYWVVTYAFTYNNAPGGWRAEANLLNVGLNERWMNTETGHFELRRIRTPVQFDGAYDPTAEPVPDPYPLDEHGTALTQVQIDAKLFSWTQFVGRPEVDFTQLGLRDVLQ